MFGKVIKMNWIHFPITLILLLLLLENIQGQSSEPDLNGNNMSPGNARTESDDDHERISKMLNKKLENYDKRLRPSFREPTKVGVTILVISLSSIKEVEMQFQVDMYFRQTWHDPRLAFKLDFTNEINLSSDFMGQIWTPDTAFRNGKSSSFHEATVPNRLIRLYENGTVLTSVRVTITAACPMNLSLYPMDHQVCGFEMQSYGYTTDKLDYYWKGGDKGVEIALDSVTLPQFVVKGYRQRSWTELTLTGSYFTLGIEFLFVRSLNYYIAQIYLPSFLIVVISYFGLWMEREIAESRLAIGVTAVLTMTAIYLAVATNGPPVSYIKAADVYLAACFLAVFTTLLESVIVTYFVKKMKGLKLERVKEKEKQRKSGIFEETTGMMKTRADLKKLILYVSKIDVVCRVLFPIILILFHVIYLAYYFNASKLEFARNYWTEIK